MPALSIAELEQLIDRNDYVELKPDGTIIVAERNSFKAHYDELLLKYETATNALGGLKALLNTPEIEDFDKAVPLEAAHQVQRWGSKHDAGKNPEDWFWLIGYLAGKALHAAKTGDREKAKHHCISTSAALRNWHAHLRTGEGVMRPGISEEKQKEASA